MPRYDDAKIKNYEDKYLETKFNYLIELLNISVKNKAYARFVVGTMSSGWTNDQVDYLCDGINDQEQINDAINDLPSSGGEIIILDGTYNITAPILIINKGNITLSGNGVNTVLKRMWRSLSLQGMIILNNSHRCNINNLCVDGNRSIYNSINNNGIHIENLSSNIIIRDNILINSAREGLHIDNSSYNIIRHNIVYNDYQGIGITGSASNNVIIGNNCFNCTQQAIILVTSSQNTITGNVCCNNGTAQIWLYSSSNYNTVTGNICIRDAGYDSSQYTIRLSSSNNNIVLGNQCKGKEPTISGTGNITEHNMV